MIIRARPLTAVIFIFVFSIFFVLAQPVRADEVGDLGRRLDDQQREIDELKDMVRAMEDKERAEKEAEAEMRKLLPVSGSNLGVFADMNFSTESRDIGNDSFSLGSLGLFSTANYNDRLNFLFEMLIEVENSGAEVDLERLWAGYTISDLLIIRAGRFHTPLGYWNKTYHHGKHLFPTVDKPFFLAFEEEDGIIPIHIIGVEVAGSADTRHARFKYWFELGNGPRLDGITGRLVPNNTSDDNGSKQAVLKASLSPRGLPGLSVGLSATTFKVNTTLKERLVERIYAVDIYYRSGGLDLLSEYFLFDNSVDSSYGYYVQLSQNFDKLTPYARYEALEVGSGDPYVTDLDGGTNRKQAIAGVRYDMDPFHSSLKFQYRRDEMVNADNYDIFEAQWSFFF